jgi:hypothetical protein
MDDDSDFIIYQNDSNNINIWFNGNKQIYNYYKRHNIQPEIKLCILHEDNTPLINCKSEYILRFNYS